MLHKSLTVGDIHIPYQWTYANAGLREAATGFVASDVGRLALQLDTYTLWVLSAVTPTWVPVSGTGSVPAHHLTHEAGGTDIIPHQNLSGAGTNAHSAIDTHLGSTSNPHSTTASQVGLGNLTDDAQLKRAAGDFSIFTEKTAPVSGDIFLIEDSAAAGAKKKLQFANVIGGVIFGKDYTAQASEGESTTTSASWQDKVTLTTPALTGVYRVNWYVEIKTSASNKFPQARVYNDTDGVELGFGQRTFSNAEIYDNFSGYANVTFTGVAKTIKLQFANTSGGTTTVRRARLSVWRVS